MAVDINVYFNARPHLRHIDISRWETEFKVKNELFLNDKDNSGDESSAKVLFKQPSTTFV